jgi:hypothetical protein
LPTLLVLLVASCALTDGATKPADASEPAPSPRRGASRHKPTRPGRPPQVGRRGQRQWSGVSKTTRMNAALDRNCPS